MSNDAREIRTLRPVKVDSFQDYASSPLRYRAIITGTIGFEPMLLVLETNVLSANTKSLKILAARSSLSILILADFVEPIYLYILKTIQCRLHASLLPLNYMIFNNNKTIFKKFKFHHIFHNSQMLAVKVIKINNSKHTTTSLSNMIFHFTRIL